MRLKTYSPPTECNNNQTASLKRSLGQNWTLQLTHDLYFQRAAGRVSFLVLGHAGVGRLVGVAFHVLNDQSSVGEDLLFAVDGQGAVI